MMKTITVVPILLAALILPACRESPSPPPPTAERYPGFKQDAAMLRDTAQVSKKDPELRGSSGKAISAARRVFTQGDLVGKTRAEVLGLLGDPKTISDYGVAAKPNKDSPLVYRFDSGFGGWQYTLHFQQDRLIRIEEQGMY